MVSPYHCGTSDPRGNSLPRWTMRHILLPINVTISGVTMMRLGLGPVAHCRMNPSGHGRPAGVKVPYLVPNPSIRGVGAPMDGLSALPWTPLVSRYLTLPCCLGAILGRGQRAPSRVGSRVGSGRRFVPAAGRNDRRCEPSGNDEDIPSGED